MSRIEIINPAPPKDTSIEELKNRTPLALQPLLDQKISATPLEGGMERTVKVRQAWHRVGAPLQLCLRTYDDDKIYVATSIKAFVEIDKNIDQGDKNYICDQFEKSVKRISSNPFPIIR